MLVGFEIWLLPHVQTELNFVYKSWSLSAQFVCVSLRESFLKSMTRFHHYVLPHRPSKHLDVNILQQKLFTVHVGTLWGARSVRWCREPTDGCLENGYLWLPSFVLNRSASDANPVLLFLSGVSLNWPPFFTLAFCSCHALLLSHLPQTPRRWSNVNLTPWEETCDRTITSMDMGKQPAAH